MTGCGHDGWVRGCPSCEAQEARAVAISLLGVTPHPAVHRAAPGDAGTHCAVCGQRVKQVPGGQGTTWVHSDTGAVAAPNPPA